MEFGELLKHVLLDLQSLFRSQFSDQEVTLPQILLLSCIPDEGLDMSTLARKMGVEPSTMTRLIGVMKKRNWVETKISGTDKRVKRVYLTDKGERLQQNLEARIESFGQSLLNSYPLEDREEIREILLSLHWGLSKKQLIR
ncbi:MAG: MarR family transcriptional regulator [FCB group bacterium]|nr:MarR family transcriptional regulator [FCB group bacterium]